jgi:hypothetical protein
MNIFSKVAKCKINTKKSAFLYTKNKQSKRNKENNIIHNSFKKLKYLRINLMKEVINLYNESQ